jgi:hypothetical protein
MNKNERNKAQCLVTFSAARLLALLLLLMLPAVAHAGFSYITTNGTVTTTGGSGSGAQTIPSTIAGLPVTTIGDLAFLSWTGLSAITIPTSVTSIGVEAFDGCTNLTTITIPSSITNIGEGAFLYCTRLTNISVDLANTTFSTLGGVLFNKNQTTLVEYPVGLLNYSNPDPNSYVVPNTVTNIGGEAFGSCILDSIVLPSNLTSIGDNAFWRCSWLSSLTIPSSVNTIGNYAFSGCARLNVLRIPAAVSTIGDGMFQSSGLTSVFFEGNAPIAGLNVYSGVNNVTNFYFSGTSGWSSSFAGRPTMQITQFFTYQNTGIPSGTVNITAYNGPSVVTIPASINGVPVTTIGVQAFLNCYYLTSITIPNSVTSFEGEAFNGCVSLTSMIFQGNAPTVYGTPSDQFTSDSNLVVYYFAGSTGWTYFSNVTGVPTVLFAPSIQIIEPTSGLQVSNATYSVIGTASGMLNVAVSNVFYSINNAAWTNATTANNWTNWTATINLIAGTNTIQAYAVDTSGNISATNSVSFNAILSTVLTVSTNGLGSLNPNYNNALLQVGKSYSITASAGTGFTFTNWTGGVSLPLAVLTNKATLQFVMQSNLVLQANFVDTNKPTVSITNLASGQRVSNAVFTVKGKASDNWQVSNVVCQLNGGAWSNAATANVWTNWTAAVNLVPGTNTVAAYAVDTTGNSSLTNSVTFQCVVTNQLQIRASGLGTISPNYSNAWLEIGRNYSITSAPASGFVFTNWLVSTNWIGGTTMNKTNLQFMMASNLTLQANFLDVTRPTNKITAPTSGQHMTNALATVVGTASDNWKVAGVWYQLNNGAWNPTTTTNSYTNWTTTVTLLVGTNTVKAYAVDLGGNYSTTNSLSVVSSNTFELQLDFAMAQPLQTNGLNFILQISSNLNGHIQVSTNLLNWLTLTNFVGTNTTLNFRDATATNFNQRFYRAVIP